jgi:hypothetical protein
MSALEAYLTHYPDGDNRPLHCKEFYVAGYIDGEMFQFQTIRALEFQIQDHVLDVLALRAELASVKKVLKEVVIISDRKHDAWDAAKALLELSKT